LKAGNRTPIHLYSPQQLKSSKLNLNLEQKNPETKFSKLFILNLEIFGHGFDGVKLIFGQFSAKFSKGTSQIPPS
jgi:hypothetical protein